jgi:hypothetical protein
MDDLQVRWWKQEPKSPAGDPWMWTLAVPSVLSATGLATFSIYAIVRLVVADVRVLDPLIVAGAVLLGIGGELGTVFSTLEVFRKYLRGRTEKSPQGEAIRADWIGLVVSFLTTVCKVSLAYGPIFGDGAQWSVWTYSPVTLALVLLESADAYVTFMEFGFYLASYDHRYESYVRSYERFLKGEYFREEPVSATEQPLAPRKEPTITDWRQMRATVNGHGATLAVSDVQRLLTEHGFAPTSASTARRWARLGTGSD